MRPRYAAALNVLLMQSGWFACVLGAAGGHPWGGAAAVAALAAVHLRLLSRQPRREGLFLAAAAVFGFLFETGLSAAGAHRPVQGPFPFPLCPPWMAALWVNFATLLNHSLRWLRQRPRAAAAAGALGGPPAYLAGAELGAATVSLPYGPLMIGGAWALALPLLVTAAARILGDGLPARG